MVLVDSRVILAVVGDDPQWAEWSQGQLERPTVLGVPLLTRDRGRYAHYFPKLALITPH